MRRPPISTPAFLQPAADWLLLLAENMSVREKIALVVLLVTLGVSSFLSVRGYINRNSHLVPETGGIYTEAAVGQPRLLNPVVTSSSNSIDSDINSLVYSSLFRFNNNLELEPDLATDYELSSDQRTYTIHLRKDVAWHDGQPFTADDVIFTIRSIQTPDYGSPLESSFQGVTIDAPDPHTVRLTLREPYGPFLTNLTVGIVPKHVWESIPPQNAALAEQMLKPIGTGPFKFSERSIRRRTGEITTYKLVRNDNYYGSRSYLDGITFVFFPTQEETTQALLGDQADGLSFLPLSDKEQVENRNSLYIRSLTLPQYTGLFFNEIKNDILSDAGVRAALSLATDRQQIVEDALKGEAIPLHIPIPPNLTELDRDFTDTIFDLERAKQNLEEAGWKDEDGDGIREKEGKRLELTITSTDWPEYIRTAELIQEQWQQIGVQVNVESLSAGVIQQTVVGPREYEILLYGEILSAVPDPYPFWHSTRTRSPGLNLSLLKDEAVDRLLEEARKTLNPDERRDKLTQFVERFTGLHPAIILYQPHYLLGYDDRVRGLSITHVNLPSSRFNDIEQWYVNARRVWNQ